MDHISHYFLMVVKYLPIANLTAAKTSSGDDTQAIADGFINDCGSFCHTRSVLAVWYSGDPGKYIFFTLSLRVAKSSGDPGSDGGSGASGIS